MPFGIIHVDKVFTTSTSAFIYKLDDPARESEEEYCFNQLEYRKIKIWLKRTCDYDLPLKFYDHIRNYLIFDIEDDIQQEFVKAGGEILSKIEII